MTKSRHLLPLVCFPALLLVSCSQSQDPYGNSPDGYYQDPNNPYNVPGVNAPPAPYNGGGNYQTPSSPNIPPPPYEGPDNSSSSSSGGGGSTHTVQRGDTLWSLSQKYGTSVSAIRSANGLSGNTIVIGQRLTIPN